ncbi:MAG TPA: hypothetical protein VFN30_07405 [Chitinophagaceae bacterium]|nr:hypothetical protein [Chitinophagaceae bacterium]
MSSKIHWVYTISLTLFLFSCAGTQHLKGFLYSPSLNAPAIGQNTITPVANNGINNEANPAVLPNQNFFIDHKKKMTDINVLQKELNSSNLYLQEGKLKVLPKNQPTVPANSKLITSMEELKQLVKNGEVEHINERKLKKAERAAEKFIQKREFNDGSSPLIWAAVFLGAALLFTIINIEVAAVIALVVGLFFLVKWIIEQSQ